MKKIITEKEFYIVAGLYHLAQEHIKQANKYEAALGELLSAESDYGSGYDLGHMGDGIYSDYTLKDAMKRDGITVKKGKKNGNT